ncbi:hypothetical protein RI129_006967 [Pyrocoelia pectoralis]|uniref:Neurotransmitter-gated ion-channel ligand-binding domain-containing protein n=1 Tax=Pyrocoelia pectoralis TaxID=417401 RepID=A0AAN7V8V8_9COLE
MDSILFRNVVVIFVIWHRAAYCDSNGGGNGFTPAQIRPKPIWNSTYTDNLKQDLLLNYDKFARPTQHYNVTTVTIGLSILHVEINEFKSTVSVNSWVRLSWTDDKLKWNASNYGGLSDVNFADHEIWQPDVMLYNSASASAVSHLGGTHCVVKDSGEIVWVPPAQLVALCDLNLRYWPFDTQQCYLKFGSWTYDGSEIDIKLADSSIDLSYVISNGEWDITDTNVTRSVKYYSCCDEPYVDAEFRLTLTRRSPAYKAIIIAPALGKFPPNSFFYSSYFSNHHAYSNGILATATSGRESTPERLYLNYYQHFYGLFHPENSSDGFAYAVNSTLLQQQPLYCMLFNANIGSCDLVIKNSAYPPITVDY